MNMKPSTSKWFAYMVVVLTVARGALAASGQGSPPKGVLRPALPIHEPALTAAQIYSKYRGAVCTVKTDSGLGTGFEASTGIWTCYHVIDGAKSISVEFPRAAGSSVNHLQAIDRTLDATVMDCPYTPLDLCFLDTKVAIGVGDPVFVIGSPRGLEQTLTEGILSGKRTINGVEYLQLSAPISPGSSGSPVFNRYGRVVGMVVGYLPDSQQINFALSAKSMAQLRGSVAVSELFRMPAFATSAAGNTPLKNIPSISLVIEDIPAELRGVFTRDDVAGWIQSELSQDAPSLKIVKPSREAVSSQGKALDDYMRKLDDNSRFLYVNIGYLTPYDEKVAPFVVRLDIQRSVLTADGAMVAGVWTNQDSGYYIVGARSSNRIRELVQGIVKDFAHAWSQQNK